MAEVSEWDFPNCIEVPSWIAMETLHTCVIKRWCRTCRRNREQPIADQALREQLLALRPEDVAWLHEVTAI